MNVYEEDLINKEVGKVAGYIPCPITKCCSELAEIDELYLPIIKILNSKGYSTVYCCSGHAYEQVPRSYIMFCLHEDFLDLPSIPRGYEKEIVERDGWMYLVISKDYNEKLNEYKLHKEIMKEAVKVLEWAHNLPPIDYLNNQVA